MTLLPLAFVLLAPAATDVDPCQSIQHTRQLAAEEGLPVSPTLEALERRHCATPPTVAAAPAEEAANDPCFELWFATELAFAGGEVDMGYAVDELRAAVCAAGGVDDTTRYANGVRVLSATGNLRYPSHAVARNEAGVWRYPNGTRALALDGTWSYPSGVRARSSTGVWSDPSGRSYKSVTDMLLAVCKGHRALCQPSLDAMKGWDGDARILGLLRVAWDAHVAERRLAEQQSKVPPAR